MAKRLLTINKAYVHEYCIYFYSTVS